MHWSSLAIQWECLHENVGSWIFNMLKVHLIGIMDFSNTIMKTLVDMFIA